MTLLLLVHAGATLFMCGVIWFVQGVHYPLFDRVGAERFPGYHRAHSDLTTRVVAPPMMAEALTSAWLATNPPPGCPHPVALGALGLVIVIWLSTAMLQIPAHRALEQGFDPVAHRRLVTSNLLRTALWTVRGVVALWMLRFL